MKCGSCGGVADNGFDRCYPPNPFDCHGCHALALLKSASCIEEDSAAQWYIEEAIKQLEFAGFKHDQD